MTTAATEKALGALPLVCSLTKYIPYPGIPHAGGQYLFAQDVALAGRAQLEYLAPDTPLNRAALPRANSGSVTATTTGRVVLLEGARISAIALRIWQLESVWAGSSIYRPIRRLFARSIPADSTRLWERLAAADVIDLQWSEMIALAPLIRRQLPESRIVGVAHDVVTQRLERRAADSRQWADVLPRALMRLAAWRSRKREAESFQAVDLLIVLSEKDAQLARELAPGVRVAVVHPGLGPAAALPRTPNEAEPKVLFVGAMNRAENRQGITWFVREIWPSILAQMPTARLIIAGANPQASLSNTIAATPRAELTGFVDSLEPYYAEASVCIVPLRRGAGVKFKTIDAILRGVPVVTTRVGAEGIDPATEPGDHAAKPQIFAAVCDDAASFAQAVVRQLRTTDEPWLARAQQWAQQTYGMPSFERRIRELYAGVN